MFLSQIPGINSNPLVHRSKLLFKDIDDIEFESVQDTKVFLSSQLIPAAPLVCFYVQFGYSEELTRGTNRPGCEVQDSASRDPEVKIRIATEG